MSGSTTTRAQAALAALAVGPLQLIPFPRVKGGRPFKALQLHDAITHGYAYMWHDGDVVMCGITRKGREALAQRGDSHVQPSQP